MIRMFPFGLLRSGLLCSLYFGQMMSRMDVEESRRFSFASAADQISDTAPVCFVSLSKHLDDALYSHDPQTVIRCNWAYLSKKACVYITTLFDFVMTIKEARQYIFNQTGSNKRWVSCKDHCEMSTVKV